MAALMDARSVDVGANRTARRGCDAAARRAVSVSVSSRERPSQLRDCHGFAWPPRPCDHRPFLCKHGVKGNIDFIPLDAITPSYPSSRPPPSSSHRAMPSRRSPCQSPHSAAARITISHTHRASSPPSSPARVRSLPSPCPCASVRRLFHLPCDSLTCQPETDSPLLPFLNQHRPIACCFFSFDRLVQN